MRLSALSVVFFLCLSTAALAEPVTLRANTGDASVAPSEFARICDQPGITCTRSPGGALSVAGPTGAVTFQPGGGGFNVSLNVGESATVNLFSLAILSTGTPPPFSGNVSFAMRFNDGAGFVFPGAPGAIFTEPVRFFYLFSLLGGVAGAGGPHLDFSPNPGPIIVGTPAGARFQLTPAGSQSANSTLPLRVTVTRLGDAAPIPEPATLILIGSGLALAALRRRKCGAGSRLTQSASRRH